MKLDFELLPQTSASSYAPCTATSSIPATNDRLPLELAADGGGSLDDLRKQNRSTRRYGWTRTCVARDSLYRLPKNACF